MIIILESILTRIVFVVTWFYYLNVTEHLLAWYKWKSQRRVQQYVCVCLDEVPED